MNFVLMNLKCLELITWDVDLPALYDRILRSTDLRCRDDDVRIRGYMVLVILLLRELVMQTLNAEP